ncbi:Uncharacterised protein [Actinomyces bovis]|uniref:Uncharacterized protein n=1 Tax=Actinomyces bovis TaxID=1658 RepID=A0ABY1VNY1_9ACTO|nr:hypothetical protein [Actinomyces bovis]SPT53452.1 Uncharacterised protein [Actinomyces bovis]VEG52932.1 Uncharacterised protein [Actinomyces israelii]
MSAASRLPAARAQAVLRGRVVNSRLRVETTGGLGAVTMTQQDGTTCGATSLLGAHLLLGGTLPGGPAARAATSKVSPTPAAALAAPRPAAEVVAALASLQQHLQRRLNRSATGGRAPLPWTRHLGSAPWAVAAEMTRVVRAHRPNAADYRLHWVRDTGAEWSDAVARLRRQLAAGLPVILLTGGPLRQAPAETTGLVARLSAVVSRTPSLPRHYVLAVPWELLGQGDPGAGQVPIYEPSAGSVSTLDLLARRDRRGTGPRELGYWPSVLGVIAPAAQHPPLGRRGRAEPLIPA